MKNKVKFVSILGDSISTYSGYNPIGYKVFYDEYNSLRNDMTSVYDTWWAKVNQFINAYICVNNSYSGSKVTGEKFPSGNCDQRTSNLHTEQYTPDMILIYLGFNDFGNGVHITNDKLGSPSFFSSYYNMLQKIKMNYPKSRIICGTLMESYMKGDNSWKFPHKWAGVSIYEYNAAIKIAAEIAGIEVAYLASQNLRYETLDGSHPTKEGHITLAKAWINCLKKTV